MLYYSECTGASGEMKKITISGGGAMWCNGIRSLLRNVIKRLFTGSLEAAKVDLHHSDMAMPFVFTIRRDLLLIFAKVQ